MLIKMQLTVQSLEGQTPPFAKHFFGIALKGKAKRQLALWFEVLDS